MTNPRIFLNLSLLLASMPTSPQTTRHHFLLPSPGSSQSVFCGRLPPLRPPIGKCCHVLGLHPGLSVFAIYTLPQSDLTPFHGFNTTCSGLPILISSPDLPLTLDLQTQPPNSNQTSPSGCSIDTSSWTSLNEDLLSFHTNLFPPVSSSVYVTARPPAA